MASQAKTTKAPKAAKSTGGKQGIRAQVAQRRRNRNMTMIGAGVVLALLVGLVVYLNIRGAQPVVGETVLPSQGNIHIDFGSFSPVAYNSTPPTSGPHYGNLVGWGIYEEPQRYEHLVHNLEDGGVVVYYQCADGCPELLQELRAVMQPYLDQGMHVVLAPNDPAWNINGGPLLHKDMESPIAITAWQRILKMDTVDSEKIRSFIEKYEGVDHHVPGIG